MQFAAKMQPDEFKAIRKSVGLTQKQLAALLGLSFSWINQTEAGKAAIEPRTKLAMLWAAAFPDEAREAALRAIEENSS